MRQNKIWVVTGANGGFGRTLVRRLLDEGYKAAAVCRNPGDAGFPENENLITVRADIRDEASVKRAKEEILKAFGRIDVVVNCAGYGLWGAVEEVSDKEARDLFDVNLFGMLNVCRTFIPDLRIQEGGTFFNLSCVDSVSARPYASVYHAAQFATDAVINCMRVETGPFGVKVICVKNGPMRTGFASRKKTAACRLDEYSALREREMGAERGLIGKEPADPDKTAALLIELSGKEEVPGNLYLTRESVERAREKWEFIENEYTEWEWATKCVDFPREECYFGKRT